MTKQKSVAGKGVAINGLTVRAGERVLLEDVSAQFSEGEITLVVGPSGVGKSILMRIIAGILDNDVEGISFDGSVRVDGEVTRKGRTGVVFQSFALFDELSPLANMDFAKTSGGSHALDTPSKEILDNLNVPTNVPTSRLSGGQRQRLAIARTLAYNPPAILYDEPTSGLDPMTAANVAQLIRKTHDDFGKTSVIVTHDYQSLIPVADRIFLLDPVSKSLKEVPKSKWQDIPDELAATKVTEPASEETAWDRIQEFGKRFFANTTGAIQAVLMGLISLLPVWKNPVWGLRFLGHFARLVGGPTAWLYLIAAGLIVGFVTTYFTFKFLPYVDYTEPLLLEDMLTALGYALYRIFVPVLASILIAARCGAAVTSDIGGRQFGNQIEAMKTFGTSPRAYLLTPILWSFLVGTPILNFLCFHVARLTSLVTFTATHAGHGPDFWDYNFHRGLVSLESPVFEGFGWLISKLLCCGFAVALISYYQGRGPKYSTTDVSRSVTSTILWSTLAVLFIHFLFALFEFEGAVPG